MPFLKDQNEAGLAPQGSYQLETSGGSRPFNELLDAAMQQDNTLGSVATAVTQPAMSPRDPSYDPFKDIAGYEDYASSFSDANSDADVQAVKSRIDGERNRRQMLESSGGMGLLAEVIAGVADPINLFPIGGEIVSASRSGARVVTAAGRAARAGLLSETGVEAVLQSTQETRTLQESALNVAATTLLSGILGGAAGALGSRAANASMDMGAITRGVMAEAAVVEREMAGNAGLGGSLSSAAARDTTLEQETLTPALGMEKALAFSSPTLRASNSPAVETRRVAQELADIPLETRKNLEGLATPVSAESRIRLWQAPLATAMTDAEDLFVRYRLGRDAQTGDMLRIGAGDLVGQSGGKLTRDAFMEEVGRAMRRGDTHEIPEVAQTAKVMREKLFDPLKQRAIENDLLPEDVSVDTALSYLTRVYNLPKIVAQRPKFEQIITDWLGGTRQDVAQRVSDMQKVQKSASARKAAIEADLPLKEARLKQVAPEADKLEKDFKAVDRQLKAADRDMRRSLREYQKAQERAEKFRPTPDLDKSDPLKQTLRDMRKGVKEPERLITFLRNQGGIKEASGEVKRLEVKNLLRANGLDLDEAALRAWEAGFFGVREDRPDINELLDLLADDAGGRPVIRESDAEQLAYIDYLKEFEKDLYGMGIDIRKMSDAEIAKRLEATETGNVDFRASTPAARAKTRENEFYARRSKAMADAAAERVRKAQPKWDDIKAKRDAAKSEADYLRAETANLARELGRKTRQSDRLTEKIEREFAFARSDVADLQDMARQITDQLLGASPARSLYTPVPLTRGPLKERTLNIPDAQIEDFLESDISKVARIYTRTMAADTELARVFGRADMQDQIDKVRENYAVLRNGVEDEKELKKLDKQMRGDIRDLEAMRDRIRGTYGLPEEPNGIWARTQRVVMDLNYIRLLGGMTLSAIPDVGRAVMTHGMERTFKDGIAPMVRDFKRFRMAADEVKLAGTALDMVLDSRAMSIADVMDDYGRWSKFERGLNGFTSRFGLVTLMAPWNAALKQFVGVISQTRTLEEIENLLAGKIKPAEKSRLAQIGIDYEMAGRIGQMARRHGEVSQGQRWANTAAWEDREAADVFRAGLSREVDTAIVTPGQERPLWMTKGIGRLIGQFRSFSIASAQRVMLSGLQRRDMATLNGAALMTGLGMLVYYIRSDHEKLSDNPAVWLREGIDRSGLTGWLFDVNNIVEKSTRGAVGVSRLTGGPMMSRYASRNVLESLLGPTAGFITDTASLAGAAATTALSDGEWTEADSRAVRRMLPLQNLFYIKGVFDAAQSGINSALGVPEN